MASVEHVLECPRCTRLNRSRGSFSATLVNAQYIVLTCQSCAEQLMFTVALPSGSFTEEVIYQLAAEA